MRKTACITFIFTLLTVSFFGQYNCNYVFASDSDSLGTWESVEPSEQYKAFIAYARSRDVTIEGSVADAITSFTSNKYQQLLNKLGIDMNSVQSQLVGLRDSQTNTWLKWAMNSWVIDLYNRLWAQFLLDYDLEVDDENVDKTVYNGKSYNGTLFFVFNSGSNGSQLAFKQDYSDGLVALGSDLTPKGSYIFDNYPLSSNNGFVGYTQNINVPDGTVYSMNAYKTRPNSYFFIRSNQNSLYCNIFEKFYSNGVIEGDGAMCYMLDLHDNSCYLGGYIIKTPQAANNTNKIVFNRMKKFNPTSDTKDTDITVTSPKVKGPIEPPEGDDYVVIEPDGNMPEPEPEPLPPGGTVPDWQLPDTQITPIDPENPSGGSNIDWNFQLPDLNIDWSINGLTEKFPFCIPSDIVRIVQILNVEPEAPHFEGTIDLMIYQWDVDIDLSEFDSVATILRNMLFLLFCAGLIIVTRSIIRG